MRDSDYTRLERKIDRLEDLVWKLYDELDNKMQELFDDSTKRFKEQNEIITSIFHGFNSEIITIKEEIQSVIKFLHKIKN